MTLTGPTVERRPLWAPTRESIAASRIGGFAAWVTQRRGLDFGDPADYDRLWRWSVAHLDQFWADLASWSGVFDRVSDDEVLTDAAMPGATWFPARTVNYAERALAPVVDGRVAPEVPALISVDERGEPATVTWAELRLAVGAFAATLRRHGVEPGDRVVGFLPNVPEAVIAFLGTAAVGAVWSSCAPDFGARAILDRFGQLAPKVLVAVDGYVFNGRGFDRTDVVAQLRGALPSVELTIAVPRLYQDVKLPDALPWADAVAEPTEPTFAELRFDAPLWVVFSSGTTGVPKGIVHGHGGVVLEQIKSLALHLDLGPGDRFFWYASTAWIMWNIATSGLLVGATVVVYDGAPAFPDVGAQFALAERTGVTYLGTSAGYLAACEKAGITPGRDHDLSRLRGVGSTGSPLPASTARWVYDAVGAGLVLGSMSGGTDVATGFIGASPLLPVTAGELQRPMLGVHAQAWDEQGLPVVGQVGELVVTAPMPSMPLYFWHDSDGAKYADAYFSQWPGVWRHGDWVEFTDQGTCVITGRSDSTLNRGGVRMGTADIYAAVEALPEVADCVVLGIEEGDGAYWMPLFVTLTDGVELTDALVTEIKRRIRTEASPRHVPDVVLAVPGIPRTRTGKRLEVPLKRLFQGVAPEKAITPGALDDAGLIETFIDLAAKRRAAARS